MDGGRKRERVEGGREGGSDNIMVIEILQIYFFDSWPGFYRITNLE